MEIQGDPHPSTQISNPPSSRLSFEALGVGHRRDRRLFTISVFVPEAVVRELVHEPLAGSV